MSYVKEVITIKKIYIVLIFLLCIAFSGIGILKLLNVETGIETTTHNKGFKIPYTEKSTEKVRCIWLNYNELSTSENDEKKYREKIDKMFLDISNADLNIAFVQVRAFNDAFYKSNYFPTSKYLCNGNVNFDALEIICDVAAEYDISVHAWINPYRVSYDTSTVANKLMLKTGSGVFYDPGNVDAQILIINGVKELITNYDIDGIHIDDYFYPADIGQTDAASYTAYTDGGGTLAQSAWRRSNVNTLLRHIYETLKSTDDDLIFSISPSADIDKNYSTYYADVYSWCGNKGYADWIIPQVYFGFENQSLPFSSTVTAWEGLIKNDSVKLIIGLPGYKIGEVDEFAGTGKNEFLTDGAGIIKKQIAEIGNREACAGYSIYSYSSLRKINQ